MSLCCFSASSFHSSPCCTSTKYLRPSTKQLLLPWLQPRPPAKARGRTDESGSHHHQHWFLTQVFLHISLKKKVFVLYYLDTELDGDFFSLLGLNFKPSVKKCLQIYEHSFFTPLFSHRLPWDSHHHVICTSIRTTWFCCVSYSFFFLIKRCKRQRMQCVWVWVWVNNNRVFYQCWFKSQKQKKNICFNYWLQKTELFSNQ